MRVRVNGEERTVTEGMTLEGLIDEIGLNRAGIAVELNREVVPRGSYAGTVLGDGDRVEIIRMVGGG